MKQNTHFYFHDKMNKVLFWILFIGITTKSVAQIKFEQGLSWDKLVEKAQREKKLVFLHLYDSKCEQCNDVAQRGFQNPMLREKYANNFVAIQIGTVSSDGKILAEKFNHKEGPLSLYLDTDQNVLFRYSGSTTSYITYLENAEKALAQRDKPSIFKQLENRYKAGERSDEFLEKYITAQKEANGEYEMLLEEYVLKQTISSLLSPRVIRFVLEQASGLDSKSRRILYSVNNVYRPGRVDSVFRTIELPERIEINKQIINKGLAKAIRDKSYTIAYQVAMFASDTYRPDYQMGNLVRQQLMGHYLKAVKDTIQYILIASKYGEDLMKLSNIDSLRKKDTQALQEQMKMASVSNGSFSFSRPSQWYHNELNNLAWSFYEMVQVPEDLTNALAWSKHSMELYEKLTPQYVSNLPKENPTLLDTYAHLLYKLNRVSEAIKWQTKAIEIQKQKGLPTKSFEKSLEDMKRDKR